MVRTFAMFVGELDFGDIPINTSNAFSVVSYAFFLVFVLMMVVILMNLLNGLAVADVGEIVRDAKVVSIKSRYSHCFVMLELLLICGYYFAFVFYVVILL